MSNIKHALVLIGALIGLTYGTTVTPDLNSPLVLDDFNDIYGDQANKSSLGAVKGWAETNKVTSGDYGYWYVVTVTDYSWVTAGISTHDTITTDNTNLLIDGHALHFFLKTKPDSSSSEDTKKYPTAEVSCNLFLDKDSVNLSKMTSISFKAKGSGTIRIGIKTHNIRLLDQWGFCSDTVKLTNTLSPFTISTSKLKPAPYSKASDNGVTWEQSKNSAYAFQIKCDGLKTPQSHDVYIDSIVFDGMKYSDVMSKKAGVRQSFGILPSYSNSAISINSGAIAYTVVKPQNFAISLFNANGKMVRTVYSGYASAGTYSVALPSSGSGTYFVRMKNTQGAVSHKFTIVK